MFKVCLCIVTFSVLPPDCENVRAMMAVRRLATAEPGRAPAAGRWPLPRHQPANYAVQTPDMLYSGQLLRNKCKVVLMAFTPAKIN